MILGHDEAKNVVQLCDGDKEVVCIERGGTGADSKKEALINFLGYVPACMKVMKTADEDNYNSTNASFCPFNSNVEEIIYKSATGETGYLKFKSKTLATFGDRTNLGVYGIEIGPNINFVQVSAHVRYLNNDTSDCQIHTFVNRYRNNTGATNAQVTDTVKGGDALTHSVSTIIPVQEGDFIYLRSSKSVAARDIDVISGTCSTQLCVEAIG